MPNQQTVSVNQLSNLAKALKQHFCLAPHISDSAKDTLGRNVVPAHPLTLGDGDNKTGVVIGEGNAYSVLNTYRCGRLLEITEEYTDEAHLQLISAYNQAFTDSTLNCQEDLPWNADYGQDELFLKLVGSYTLHNMFDSTVGQGDPAGNFKLKWITPPEGDPETDSYAVMGYITEVGVTTKVLTIGSATYYPLLWLYATCNHPIIIKVTDLLPGMMSLDINVNIGIYLRTRKNYNSRLNNNFIRALAASLAMLPGTSLVFTVVGQDGTDKALTANVFTDIMSLTAPGAGIIPASTQANLNPDAYLPATPIANGNGSGQLSYGETTFDGYFFAPGGAALIISRIFTNNASTAVDVKGWMLAASDVAYIIGAGDTGQAYTLLPGYRLQITIKLIVGAKA